MAVEAQPVQRPSPALPGYLPIAEHGIIGDLHTVALVGTDGTIDWYCCPHFDSPSVFGAILDKERGGYYRIAPAAEGWTQKQLYFPDTNVLITRFLTPDGVAEVQDFMPIHHAPGSVYKHRLIRRLVGVRGELTFRIEVEPRFNYGRDPHNVVFHESGVVFHSQDMSLALQTSRPLSQTEHGVVSEITVPAGPRAHLRARAGPRELRPAPLLRGRDPRRLRPDDRVLALAGWPSRATRAAGARPCTARR